MYYILGDGDADATTQAIVIATAAQDAAATFNTCNVGKDGIYRDEGLKCIQDALFKAASDGQALVNQYNLTPTQELRDKMVANTTLQTKLRALMGSDQPTPTAATPSTATATEGPIVAAPKPPTAADVAEAIRQMQPAPAPRTPAWMWAAGAGMAGIVLTLLLRR